MWSLWASSSMRRDGGGETEFLAQSLPDAACVLPFLIRTDVHAEQSACLPDPRFDLRRDELVLHMRQKALRVCKLCKCAELSRTCAEPTRCGTGRSEDPAGRRTVSRVRRPVSGTGGSTPHRGAIAPGARLHDQRRAALRTVPRCHATLSVAPVRYNLMLPSSNGPYFEQHAMNIPRA